MEKKIILKEFKVFIPFDGIKQNADDVSVKFTQPLLEISFFFFSFHHKSTSNMDNHQNSSLLLLLILIMIVIIIFPRYNSGIRSKHVSLLYNYNITINLYFN